MANHQPRAVFVETPEPHREIRRQGGTRRRSARARPEPSARPASLEILFFSSELAPGRRRRAGRRGGIAPQSLASAGTRSRSSPLYGSRAGRWARRLKGLPVRVPVASANKFEAERRRPPQGARALFVYHPALFERREIWHGGPRLPGQPPSPFSARRGWGGARVETRRGSFQRLADRSAVVRWPGPRAARHCQERTGPAAVFTSTWPTGDSFRRRCSRNWAGRRGCWTGAASRSSSTTGSRPQGRAGVRRRDHAAQPDLQTRSHRSGAPGWTACCANGVDAGASRRHRSEIWDPSSDPRLPARYDAAKLHGKSARRLPSATRLKVAAGSRSSWR